MKKIALSLLIFLLLGNAKYDQKDAYKEIKKPITIEQVYKQDTIDTYNIIVPNNIDYNYYLFDLAKSLNITYEDLFTIIAYETNGTFNPNSINHTSGARGLLQFNDVSAKTIKNKKGVHFKNVNELINEYPTVKAQLAFPTKQDKIGGPVYQYLKNHGPYKNSSDLFLAVFYPSSRNKGGNMILPANVQRQNPGIIYARDYYKIAKNKIKFTHGIIAD